MTRYSRIAGTVAVLVGVAGAATGRAEEGPNAEQVEFFEMRIRPVLVERCYECHNSAAKKESGLAVDWRGGLIQGGDSGPAVVPGKPEESWLLHALKHEQELKMPKGGPKVSQAVVADFTKWIRGAAPDPRLRPPSAAEIARVTSWESLRERRKQWWSLQPVASPPLPAVRDAAWSSHPVDRFILAKLEAAGLPPAALADRRTWLRRVTWALIGLPPTPAEIADFLRDDSPDSHERVVDRLLASPHFGERWARHWMDWFRYADTHGSEGDPAIPYAWRYRDYLIRAWNADVPYDQLLREHIAGDLLPKPRLNAESGLNESALGPGHLRMVLHGYAPTDALDEQATFTENQIDVLSKAVLGLTVACARCHNHKFDAVSQADFYALYGVLASCRPALITVDAPSQKQAAIREQLAAAKQQLRQGLADHWLRTVDDLADDLADKLLKLPKTEKGERHPLDGWLGLQSLDAQAFRKEWTRRRNDWQAAESKRAAQGAVRRWDLAGEGAAAWFKHGLGLPEKPTAAGDFHILPEGPQVVANVYPAGIFTHLVSSKDDGVLLSPRFTVDSDWISLRVAGGGSARMRLVVQNYPRLTGPIYYGSTPNRESLGWVHWNTQYWRGETVSIECATADDLPVEIKPSGRSWFGIAEVAMTSAAQERPTDRETPLFALAADASPQSPQDLTNLVRDLLRGSLTAWRDARATNDQAEFLGALVRLGMLPNTVDSLGDLAEPLTQYRRLEKELRTPTRAPGVWEADSFDQRLFVRGNHKQLGETIPRRFLEAIDATPFQTTGSGRLELAEQLVSRRNPLTTRVIVNRLWHHLFGEGLVPTVDNFGQLGQTPTHPELLDALATRFAADGWSLKRMLRLLVLSKTYQLGSLAPPKAAEVDPGNQLLSHFRVRRLEAEAIRDGLLAVSGQLDPLMFGPGEGGRGRRRSVYVAVRRNSFDPLLEAFDAPRTQSTQGRRDATNVPAQSLMLLNDPWVIDQARRWAESLAADPALASSAARLARMYVVALGREPTAEEEREALAFLRELATEQGIAAEGIPQNLRLWQDLAQSLVNLKEFIYVR